MNYNFIVFCSLKKGKMKSSSSEICEDDGFHVSGKQRYIVSHMVGLSLTALMASSLNHIL